MTTRGLEVICYLYHMHVSKYANIYIYIYFHIDIYTTHHGEARY